MTINADAPETMAWRLGHLEARVEHIDANKADAADFTDLTSEFRGLRKILNAVLIAIVGSTLIFAGGVLGIAAQVH